MTLRTDSDAAFPIFSETYVLDPRPRYPLRIVTKRYWTKEYHGLPVVDDHDVFSKSGEDIRTLVFVHGIGCHKEHWEPTVQRLFEHERSSRISTVQIRDVWSLDLPNHGDSAVLNERDLLSGYETFSWETYARGIHALLAGIGSGVDVDFSKRRLTLVGHSVGASILTLVPKYYPFVKLSSLHLIEPLVIGEKGLSWISRFVELVAVREPVDSWPTEEAAYQAIRVRRQFFHWDERILEIFIRYGLRPLPTAGYSNKTEGVTLKCMRKQQVAGCRNLRSFDVVYRHFARVLKKVPTHITHGSILDTLPYELWRDALHVASGGISKFASVTRANGAGHMMVQTHPDVVGDIIWKQLNQSQASLQITDAIELAKL